MREIKFRAWDKTWKKMNYGSVWDIRQNDNFILMQFTGLKDKNGKEIYEGDIVFSHDIGEVEFYKGCFYVSFPDGDIAFDGLVAENIEVTGNIYENPELLEASK